MTFKIMQTDILYFYLLACTDVHDNYDERYLTMLTLSAEAGFHNGLVKLQ
jgi:hypothetical protein